MDARYTALPHAPATRERQLHQPQAARVLLDSLKEVLTSIFGERGVAGVHADLPSGHS